MGYKYVVANVGRFSEHPTLVQFDCGTGNFHQLVARCTGHGVDSLQFFYCSVQFSVHDKTSLPSDFEPTTGNVDHFIVHHGDGAGAIVFDFQRLVDRKKGGQAGEGDREWAHRSSSVLPAIIWDDCPAGPTAAALHDKLDAPFEQQPVILKPAVVNASNANSRTLCLRKKRLLYLYDRKI
uniref:Uncharacterized protein n=1 Tax=Romanomermis culicivorax TaxID=13658 RepID=A0A915IL68_ROMCU